jgi:APA family basic amino acid/polyamine antiporter
LSARETQSDRRPVAQDSEFVKGLGLTSATTLVMGSMIGSGVFIVAADIARQVDSPALLVGAWIVSGFMTVVAALAYGELAAMMPRAGGQYVYLHESLGPLWGWLYGWTLFLVIQTGTIAAVAVAFGKFLGVFFPTISSTNWKWHIAHIPPLPLGPMVLGNMDIGLNTANLVGIGIVILLSVVNIFGVKTGALVQNVFTFAKLASLFGLIGFGLVAAGNPAALAANFGGSFWHMGAQHAQVGMTGLALIVVLLAVAQVGSLFSADAWNNVTFTAGEVRNPSRNLPLSLAIGTGIVILLYIAANLVYMRELPLAGDPHGATVLARGIKYAAEDRVGTAALQVLLGRAGAAIMAATILISTFGCNNGLILAGARVYYAMAKDGLFFKSVGRLHPKYKTPVVSLGVQAVWTCLLCLSGTYGQLLDYIIFAVLVFYIMTIVGLFVLRRKRPEAPRPYRAFGYPVLPALYVAMAVFIDAVLLRYKPQYTWPGLLIVVLGVPVFFVWHGRKARRAQGECGSSEANA